MSKQTKQNNENCEFNGKWHDRVYLCYEDLPQITHCQLINFIVFLNIIHLKMLIRDGITI